jgi:hypothetical protein
MFFSGGTQLNNAECMFFSRGNPECMFFSGGTQLNNAECMFFL